MGTGGRGQFQVEIGRLRSQQALAELVKLSGTRYDGMLVRILMRELKNERSPTRLEK